MLVLRTGVIQVIFEIIVRSKYVIKIIYAVVKYGYMYEYVRSEISALRDT